MKQRDAVIIGGGLAGAAAAAQLSHQGVDVVLLEKEVAPSHKICGEFISYEAQHYLEKLGVDLGVCGAHPISWLRLIRHYKTIEVPLGFQALSLSRRYLDEAILERARQQGAEIKRGITVTGVTQNSSGWLIQCHEREPIITKSVFHATGKHDLRAWSNRKGWQNDYISFKMHYKISESQQIQMARYVEIIFYQGGYAGLELVEGGIANLCLVITKQQFALWGKNWTTLIQELMNVTPLLSKRLNNATPCWEKPLSIYGIPYGFVYQPAANDPSALYRLGDQMAVIPSLCGDGMAIALHTGFLAAECYLTTSSFDYHQRARGQLLGQIRYASIMAKLLSYSALQPLILSVCRLFPRLILNSIKHTRIQAVQR